MSGLAVTEREMHKISDWHKRFCLAVCFLKRVHVFVAICLSVFALIANVVLFAAPWGNCARYVLVRDKIYLYYYYYYLLSYNDLGLRQGEMQKCHGIAKRFTELFQDSRFNPRVWPPSLDDITPHTVSDGSFYVSYGEIPDPVFIDDLAPTVRYLDSHNRFVSWPSKVFGLLQFNGWSGYTQCSHFVISHVPILRTCLQQWQLDNRCLCERMLESKQEITLIYKEFFIS